MPTSDQYDLQLAAGRGWHAVVDRLILSKVNVNKSHPWRPDAPTPLHAAIRGNHVECVKRLVRAGADYLTIVDKDNCNAIFASVRAGHHRTVKALFEAVDQQTPPQSDKDGALSWHLLKSMRGGEKNCSLLELARARCSACGDLSSTQIDNLVFIRSMSEKEAFAHNKAKDEKRAMDIIEQQMKAQFQVQ